METPGQDRAIVIVSFLRQGKNSIIENGYENWGEGIHMDAKEVKVEELYGKWYEQCVDGAILTIEKP
ncbi:MAG: hypothetical protein J6M27_14995 [Lachnospiraceae bacterium]|nr:hypothetical protein [Lachnospiraceae bacterium]